MTTTNGLAELAKELRAKQEAIKNARAELKVMEQDQTELSKQIVAEIQGMGMDETVEEVRVKDVGTVKLVTKPHPYIKDLDEFIAWCTENNTEVPKVSVNASTLAAWYAEQVKQGQSVPPEDVCSVAWSTVARVNK